LIDCIYAIRLLLLPVHRQIGTQQFGTLTDR